jgi:hypothetical protein
MFQNKNCAELEICYTPPPPHASYGENLKRKRKKGGNVEEKGRKINIFDRLKLKW